MFPKLVRDRVPEAISARGAVPHFRVATEQERFGLLTGKFREEAAALAGTPPEQTAARLAELYELLCSMAANRGLSLEQLEQIRAQRYSVEGGFERLIILIGTTDHNQVA